MLFSFFSCMPCVIIWYSDRLYKIVKTKSLKTRKWSKSRIINSVSLLVFFLTTVGLRERLYNSQNISMYYVLNHWTRYINLYINYVHKGWSPGCINENNGWMSIFVSCSISEVVNDLKESSKHAKYLENISAKQVVHFIYHKCT